MTNIRTQGVCALVVAGVLFFGAPVQALTVDAQLESLWKQVAELQKQIAELQKAQGETVKAVEPVFAAAVMATSTATTTEVAPKKQECAKTFFIGKQKVCTYAW